MWQPEVDPAIESSATVRANMESSASLDAPKRGESATNMERKKVVTNSIAYLMRKAIGGNQVAIKWQSSGNQVAIKWQSSGNQVAIKWQSEPDVRGELDRVRRELPQQPAPADASEIVGARNVEKEAGEDASEGGEDEVEPHLRRRCGGHVHAHAWGAHIHVRGVRGAGAGRVRGESGVSCTSCSRPARVIPRGEGGRAPLPR